MSLIVVALSLAFAGSASARPLDAPMARAAALPLCTILGSPGQDVLRGTPGNDVICAVAGNDRVYGGGGNDVIFGGPGNDRLYGGPGNDRLYGFGGRDRLYGGPGNDVLQGAAGPDVLSGGPGNDTADYRLRAGRVRVSIGRGADDGAPGERDNVLGDVENVRGGHGNDLLIGNGRNNRLWGGRGNDVLRGGGGNDRLSGGPGRDRLNGLDSFGFKDSLSCGSGTDRAFAETVDHVSADCELVTRRHKPSGHPNHAPTAISLSNDRVAENSPAGTPVGTLTAADPDAGQHHTYALVTGTGSADNSWFTIVGSTLQTTSAFDYEAKRSYSIRVRATDDGHPPRSVERVLTVSVTDVNEPPTAISLSPASVPENKPAGTAVGTFSASDPDAGDSATYALVSGAGDADNGAFAIDGSTLRTAKVFDFETKPSYSIRVRATDHGTPAGSIERAFTITVENVNDAPAADDKHLDGVTEDGSKPVELSGTDVEGDALTFHVAQPAHGQVDTTTPAATCDGNTPSTCTASVVYTPDSDFNGTDTFTYKVNDGTSDSAPATVTATVDPVNDPPTASDGVVNVDEGTATPVDLGALVTDVETSDADLAYTIVNGPSNGTLTGSGPDRTYTPKPGFNGSDSFTYNVTDRGDPDNCSGGLPACDAPATSQTRTVTLTVAPVNDAPVAGDTTKHVGEDHPLSVDLTALASDTETNAANLTYTIVHGPSNGTLSGSGPSQTYTPGPNYNGDDSFTYEVTDRGDPDNCGPAGPGCAAAKTSDVGTVSIVVDPVNDAPVADDGSLSTDEGTPAPVDLGALVSDVETSDTNLTYTILSGPGHGTLTGSGHDQTYTPDQDYNGGDSFTYQVTDRGDPDSCSGGAPACDAPLSSQTKTVSITVAPVNSKPVAGDGSASASEDTPSAIDLTNFASDVETNPANLTYDVIAGPTHGTLAGSGANRTYTPDPNYNGDDSFTYQVTDRGDPDNCGPAGPGCAGPKTSSLGTVSITVAPVNDVPVADDGSLSTDENTPAAIDLGPLVSDLETSDANLTYEILTGPTHGQLTPNGTSQTYTPDANYNGSDSFTYRVTDRGDPDACGAPGPKCDGPRSSATKTVSITVAPVNSPPVAGDGTATTDEDNATAIDLTAFAADLETSPANLTYTIITGPTHGTLTGSGPSKTYTPNPDYNGDDSFTYQVTDRGDPDNCGAPGPGCAAPETSGTGTVSITVNAVNDAPVNTLPAGPLTAVQDTDTPIAGLSVADVDAGGDDVQVTLAVAHGTLTVNTAAFGGVSPLQVTGNGTRTVVVTAPLAALNATFGDANGVVYHGDSAYTGPDTLTMTSDDLGHNGSGGAKTDTDTLALDVVPPNQAPVAAAQNVSTNEDSAKSITLSATDADGDALTFAKGTGPSHGSLGSIGSATCDNATPSTCTASVTYTPGANYNGSDSFTFTANDGTADSAPATVSITVDPVNDVPVAGNGSANATEDTAGTIDLSTFASDVETNPANLTYTIVGSPSHGTLSGSGGSRTYTPAANYNGSDSFTYTVTDRGDPDNCGAAGPGCAAAKTSSSGTVSITVAPVNDQPTANDGTLTTNEDQSGSVDLGALVSDVETSDANLTYTIVGTPSHGTLSGSGTSRTYTPAANYDGSDSFTYTVTDRGDPDNCGAPTATCDAAKTSATKTISITVTPVNDAPTLGNTESGTLAYTENDPATQITATTTVDDIDSANFDTGTLTVDYSTGGTVDDRFGIANQGQIATSGSNVTFGGTPIGTFTGGSGTTPLVVTLNASATPTATQALVRSITYSNVSDNPSTAARTVRFVLTDGDGGTSAAATRAIALTAVNDPPALAGIEGSQVNYIESVDSPPSQSQVTNSLTVSDPDNANLTGATVQITTGCNPAEDLLVFSNQNNITGNYTTGTCTLTLNGSSSVANYQAALRSIKYQDSSDTPDTTTRTVTFRVDDGQSANHASNAQPRDITVTPSNDSPSATGDTFTSAARSALANTTLAVGTSPTEPNVSVSDNVLANDTDPDSPHADLTAFASSASAQGGVVAMNSDGTFSYTPKPGFTGQDTITYTVHDHGSPDRTATATITINVVGPTPWYVDDSAASAGANGTSAHPFTSLAPLSTGGSADTLDGSGDRIFVYSGTYTSGIALENNQQLIGQPQGLSVTDNNNRTLNLVTAGGTAPAISASSGPVVGLASGNDLESLALGNAGSGAASLSGTSVGNASASGTTINNTAGKAIDIDTGTLGMAFGSVSSSGSGSEGVKLTNIAGSITMNGGTLSNATNADIAISQGNADVTYKGSISDSGGTAVSVANATGGTKSFTGAIGSAGVSLTGNSASTTMSFTGALTLNTGTSPAFTATGGGTVTATNAASTLTTTTGTALNVANTTIGAGGLTFQSITAGGAGSGPTNGIVLNNTGSTAGLTVTGNGGTCTSLASTCTGGTIQSTTGHAILLTSTKSPSFSFMKVTNVALSGIYGTGVTNFTLDHSVIDGVNTSHTAHDSDVAFNLSAGGANENNLSGNVSITNSTINNSYQFGIDIYNYSGTISNLAITGNSLTSSTDRTLTSASAIDVGADRSTGNHASITAGSITGNTIQNFPSGAGIQVIGGNTSAGQAVAIASSASPFLIQDNTITGAGTGTPTQPGVSPLLGTNGIAVTAGQSTTAYFTIGQSGHPNTITNVGGNGVACSLFGAGTEKCAITFNVINAHNFAGSPGINTGADQATAVTGNNTTAAAQVGTLYLDIHNNNVSNTNGNGILSTVRSVSSNGIFHIENNTVAQPVTTSGTVYGIRADSGNGLGSPTVCAKISGNTTTGSTNGSTVTAPGIGLRQSHSDPSGGIGTFHIDGLTPSPANDAQMEAYVGNGSGGQNPGSANGTFGATGVASISSGGTFTSGTCTIP